MPSSISSFEALPDAVRATAADRPGEAQPVPVRPVPPRPWRGIAATAVLLAVIAIAGWEWQMRRVGLRAGDYGIEPSGWAAARRQIDMGDLPVAIVGDSRILFDTDLDRFQQLTGVRPLQLALPGSNARPFLEDVANDPHFHGLLIVGLADMSYFRDGIGNGERALDRSHSEMPSQRTGYLLSRVLERNFAFIDPAYRLSTLVYTTDRGQRRGGASWYYRPWKLIQVDERGQASLWSKIETDSHLRAQARQAWLDMPGRPPRPPVDAKTIESTLAKTQAAVARIRARGGDVVFVRPPSSGPLRVREEQRIPRRLGWDALLARAQAVGIHVDDHPQLQGLDIPEWSHLSQRCASVYTDAYVRLLAAATSRVAIRADAPGPLTPRDCVTKSPGHTAADAGSLSGQ
ncbi:hypothetical protein [Lysobacter sp. TY2-98]|uniref:hypothetical protein n=1 Tax=Lysobacter sp. TY2-98 TaxID=2290922 RepID=UPI0013B3CBB1|nr:hypothetical protein [Lysobacter sp. TY2-98]